MFTRPTRAALVVGLALVAALVASPAVASSTPGADTTAAADTVNFGDDMIIVPGVTPTTHTSTKSSPTAKSGKSTTSGTASSESSSDNEASTATAVEKVYVSVASVTAKTSDDVNTDLTKAKVQTLIAQMNTYWSAESSGAVSIVFGGYETRSLGASSCAPSSVLSKEDAAAFDGQFADDSWIDTHSHLMVLTTEACNSSAFATVGGNGGEIFSGNGLSASLGLPYVLHEFGHNLGFLHADSSLCTNTSSFDGQASSFSFSSTVCPTTEYDDYLDIMGYTVKGAIPHLSSIQKIEVGWLTDYATVDSSTGATTVTLSSLDADSGTQAIKVVDPTSGDVYFVEYRTPEGRDATSAEFRYDRQCAAPVKGYTSCDLGSSTTYGVVRILRELDFPNLAASGTTVMATGTSAGTTEKKRYTHLNSGARFTSHAGDVSIKINSISMTKGASITVTFPTPAAAKAKSATTVKLTKKTITKSGRAKVTVAVTVAGTTSPTGTVAIYANGHKVKAYKLTAAKHGSLTVTLKKLAAGTKKITAKYSGTTSTAKSTSAAKTLKVTK